MSLKQQRTIRDLKQRLTGHGHLIEEQQHLLEEKRQQVFEARAAAVIGWLGLLYLAGHLLISRFWALIA